MSLFPARLKLPEVRDWVFCQPPYPQLLAQPWHQTEKRVCLWLNLAACHGRKSQSRRGDSCMWHPQEAAQSRELKQKQRLREGMQQPWEEEGHPPLHRRERTMPVRRSRGAVTQGLWSVFQTHGPSRNYEAYTTPLFICRGWMTAPSREPRAHWGLHKPCGFEFDTSGERSRRLTLASGRREGLGTPSRPDTHGESHRFHSWMGEKGCITWFCRVNHF